MQKLRFFYIDFSSFHGNGTVVWLSENRFLQVQKASQPEQLNRIFQITLDAETFKKISAKIESIDTTKLAVVERAGIPDEVSIKAGVRTTNSKLNSVRVWDGDWPKQSLNVQKLNEIAMELALLGAKGKPRLKQKFSRGALRIDRPSEISAQDLDSALGL